jgi:hypothetical protein
MYMLFSGVWRAGVTKPSQKGSKLPHRRKERNFVVPKREKKNGVEKKEMGGERENHRFYNLLSTNIQ